MKKSARFAALLLTVMMLLGVSTVSQASSVGTFDDVPTSHWAHEQINTIAQGGLISGYGNGKFGPNDSFTIAQVAAIISNVLGYEGYTKDGFWAYGYVDYCVNTLKCLPSHGAISAKNYNVPVTRELAVHMLISSLGIKTAPEFPEQLRPNDIPDSQNIQAPYLDAVMSAYRNGVLTGVDSKRTFDPKGILTRAQGAAMLVNIGCTKVIDQNCDPTEMDPILCWAKIKELGAWEDWTCRTDSFYDSYEIRFTDPKLGGIEVSFNVCTGIFNIHLYEWNYWDMYNEKGQCIDVNGNVIDWHYDEEYNFFGSTGYSLEARRFCKQIFAAIVGPEVAETLYADMKAVFLGEVYDRGGGRPYRFQWNANRSISMNNNMENCFTAAFGSPHDEFGHKVSLYDLYISGMQIPPTYHFQFERAVKAYHLDQW